MTSSIFEQKLVMNIAKMRKNIQLKKIPFLFPLKGPVINNNNNKSLMIFKR